MTTSERHLAADTRDGSAGDVDYGKVGGGYARYRQPEPAIAALIEQALGRARSVLNVGAGAGSYEPRDREVTAVEPSAAMRAQRPSHLGEAINSTAENLPFADKAFDAAMATFTVHQWQNLSSGLSNIRRVTRGPVVVLTCNPAKVEEFWLAEYAPAVLATEAKRYPALDQIAAYLGGRIEIVPVPIPLECADGFNEAYYGRPERLLDKGARQACSAWSFVDPSVSEASITRLADDLTSRAWDRRHGRLRTQASYDGSLYLIVSHG